MSIFQKGVTALAVTTISLVIGQLLALHWVCFAIGCAIVYNHLDLEIKTKGKK